MVLSVPRLLSFVALTGYSTVWAQGSDDPCAAVAGKPYVSPSDFRACEKAFPFNETLRQNVLSNAAKILDGFFSFVDYYKDSPAPFEESTVDIWGEINRINTTSYETDYDFNWDLFIFSSKLNDGHTKWYPDCYTSVQNILPAPVVSLSVDGEESLYIAPDLLEVIPLLNDTFTDYLASINFDWKRLASAKVLEIDGKSAYDYVDEVARDVSGNFLDHGVRVNSVYTSYRVSGGDYSQKLGDLAAPIGLARDSLKFKVILANSTTEEEIDIPYVANFYGNAFTDKDSYWAKNCVATSATNGQDLKDSATAAKLQPRKFPKGELFEVGRARAPAIKMPSAFKPNLTAGPGSEDAIRSYYLDGNQTGVLFVSTFSPSDYYGFQTDVVQAVDAFKAAGITNLIIDLTDNGGGYVCLGQYLFKYLLGSNHVDNPGFQSTLRASGIARRIVASDIALGLDASLTFYTPDNYADISNNTQFDKTHNYVEPPVIETINGIDSPVSERYFDTCESSFEEELPAEPPFALENVVIVGNSWCASTCAMFSTLMSEKAGTKIASFGAKPGETMEYKGMAGNQVLDWADLATEIKTADMENDPDAPPDLLVSGDFRVNWRTAYSWVEEDKPIAYRSDLAKYRFPYTPETYMNPANVWKFAETEFFKNSSSSSTESSRRRRFSVGI